MEDVFGKAYQYVCKKCKKSFWSFHGPKTAKRCVWCGGKECLKQKKGAKNDK